MPELQHTATFRLRQILKDAATQKMGFLTEEEVETLAACNETRLLWLLVRCGGCRFSAPSQDVRTMIRYVELGGDYVRDVSIPYAKCEEIKNAVSLGAW